MSNPTDPSPRSAQSSHSGTHRVHSKSYSSHGQGHGPVQAQGHTSSSHGRDKRKSKHRPISSDDDDDAELELPMKENKDKDKDVKDVKDSKDPKESSRGQIQTNSTPVHVKMNESSFTSAPLVFDSDLSDTDEVGIEHHISKQESHFEGKSILDSLTEYFYHSCCSMGMPITRFYPTKNSKGQPDYKMSN
ncbi:MAG: hypothetical protein Sylvanvirus18_8 [Sylvanvirus sp.]|uniref:Uncharacterized protein n=1 Tax=Sylvanvirus sp. TaxID=2487774 RepID=A0A3G5AIG7_9VIRU|nr:MAG: hypothetical protein Sylvanvirus18_8 [Sylvanvirus sp.]